MRKKTEDALKENFDVRAFHDMVLSQGSVTLSILEKMTDRFIKEQLAKQGKKDEYKSRCETKAFPAY